MTWTGEWAPEWRWVIALRAYCELWGSALSFSAFVDMNWVGWGVARGGLLAVVSCSFYWCFTVL